MNLPDNINNEGKLGQRFMSTDELEEVDIENGDKPRPTYISKKLEKEFKSKMVDLLKEF